MKKLFLALTIALLSTQSFSADSTPASMKPAESEPTTTSTAPQIGSPAPVFKTFDINNVPVDISELKGKNIVLEWFNKDCPFVRKQYDTQTMQKLQSLAKEQDIAWITITSSAPGKQGHLTQDEAKEVYKKEGMASAYYILDESGEIGHLYRASTTPHMFIIDKKGNLAYMGAIDNKPSADKKDIAGALNYVKSAMNALYHNAELKTQVTQPYGCGVKY